MKVNLPVSDIESPFPKGKILVSKTDPKGIITYANDAFIELSGFTQEELQGKNHNIVRHPDMPPEAFADLWATVKDGHPWRGVVKNRCKNGDYYWVDALVVPIRANNQTVGYMSVRKEPSRQQVAEAEALYRQIRDGKAQLKAKAGVLSNLSLKTKSALFMAMNAVMLIAVGLLGLYDTTQSDKGLNLALDATTAITRSVDTARSAQVAFKKQVQEWKDILLRGNDPAAFEKYSQNFSKQDQTVQEKLSELKGLMAQMGLSTDAVDDALATHAALGEKYREALKSYDASDAKAAHVVDKLVKGIDRAPTDKIDGLVTLVQDHADKVVADFRQQSAEKSRLTLLLTLIVIVAATALGFLMSALAARAIRRPLTTAIGIFDQIAQGNLDNDIDIGRRDELGQLLASLAYTQIHLRVIMDEISLAATSIRQRYTELETEVQRVVAHSQEQQDRAMQVTAAMEEVSVSITEVATSAKGAANTAKESLAIVQDGEVQMSRSLESTSHVVQAVQDSGGTINALSHSIEQIGSVTQVIKDIADQTNLLALNAAIEAARAGEQGRGFAVVADEVRKLAERTASSTAHIAQMVEEIQATARSAVAAMDKAAQKVDEGRGLLQASGRNFEQVSEASGRITGMAEHIADATREQSTASEDIAKNMEHITALIEENGSSIRQVEESMSNLAGTAESLRQLVAHFERTAA